VPGTTYGLSKNGWILFKEWFIATSYVMQDQADFYYCCWMAIVPTSYNVEASKLARESDVIVFTLVPHTTHEMQPLDTAMFGPLKKSWNEECHEIVQSYPGKIITK